MTPAPKQHPALRAATDAGEAGDRAAYVGLVLRRPRGVRFERLMAAWETGQFCRRVRADREREAADA